LKSSCVYLIIVWQKCDSEKWRWIAEFSGWAVCWLVDIYTAARCRLYRATLLPTRSLW